VVRVAYLYTGSLLRELRGGGEGLCNLQNNIPGV
jgi:hypothetical protein